MKTADFDYVLPPERIAQEPVVPRDASRLLTIGPCLEDRGIRDLPEILCPGDLMVFNDTRVLPTRLRGHRRGAKVEVTLHKDLGAAQRDSDGDDTRWLAFARPARKLKPGDHIDFPEGLEAEVLEKRAGGEVLLRINRKDSELIAALKEFGQLPLPPYIKRPATGSSSDTTDYQTVYARRDGAVAAPTAGLHFTETLLEALRTRGVGSLFVTLHVGAGTFLPVTSEDANEHRMHNEFGEITAEAVERIKVTKAGGGRIIAVGTTVLRLLETAALDSNGLKAFCGETDIFILPGFEFRVTDLLLTNFHLPRSTLFMLVCAFAGRERMLRAYEHAIAQDYRFYSYGDACLLERRDQIDESQTA
jgi:S-adenosylmethionine:tRNA ribosyltransferase-isomerase